MNKYILGSHCSLLPMGDETVGLGDEKVGDEKVGDEKVGDETVGDETVGGRNDRIPVEPFLCMLFSHFYLYIESFLFSINHDFTYRYVL